MGAQAAHSHLRHSIFSTYGPKQVLARLSQQQQASLPVKVHCFRLIKKKSLQLGIFNKPAIIKRSSIAVAGGIGLQRGISLQGWKYAAQRGGSSRRTGVLRSTDVPNRTSACGVRISYSPSLDFTGTNDATWILSIRLQVCSALLRPTSPFRSFDRRLRPSWDLVWRATLERWMSRRSWRQKFLSDFLNPDSSF